MSNRPSTRLRKFSFGDDGPPPWLVGLAIMLAILVVYRLADIYGFLPDALISGDVP